MIQRGIPNNFPIKVMETDVAQVAEGTDGGGWVSGTPANLAASASMACVFDLGIDWHQFTLLQIAVKPSTPSSGLNNVNVTCGDTVAGLTDTRRLTFANSNALNTIYTNIASAAGTQAMLVRPMGRYVSVNGVNADAANAQGPGSKVTLAAYSN